jgi:hypothetical protein
MPEDQAAIEMICAALNDHGSHLTPLAELQEQAQQKRIDPRILKQALRYLCDHKKIYSIQNAYLPAELVNAYRLKLLNALSQKPEGLGVAQFRDLIGANRKLCVALLETYDGEGIIVRAGDQRLITEKGRVVLAKDN